jgi:L-fuconolactonase
VTTAVVDAHHHLVFPDLVAYPDLERHMPEIHRTIGPDDLEPLLRDAGVDRTVVVQATNDVAETSILVDLAHRLPWLVAVVGWLPLDDAATVVDALSVHDDPVLVGVRHLLHREPDPGWLSDPARLDALRVLAANDLLYEVCALGKGHLDNVPAVIEEVPELTLVIDHLGGPYVRGDRWEPWASLMSAAAQHPRCLVKLSSLDPIDGSVEPYRRYVEHVLDAFGADRVLWASNWPATRLGASYRAMLDDARALLPAMDEGARTAVFGGNALRVYRPR